MRQKGGEGRKISWSRKSSNRLMFFSILFGFKLISPKLPWIPEICWWCETGGWLPLAMHYHFRVMWILQFKKKNTCVPHIWGADCELFEDILVPFTLSALASGTNCWPKRLLLNRTSRLDFLRIYYLCQIENLKLLMFLVFPVVFDGCENSKKILEVLAHQNNGT